MFKSQLQEYTQKAGLPDPKYTFTREGPCHASRFQAQVLVEDTTYESDPGFPNLKSAEQAAAQVTLQALAKTPTASFPGPVHKTGLCKNLLQEYAQKQDLPLPIYRCERTGASPFVFNASVVIAGAEYQGGAAKSKKEAEIKAARKALLAIRALPGAASNDALSTSNQADMSDIWLWSTYLGELAGKKKRGHSSISLPEAQVPKAKLVKEEPVDDGSSTVAVTESGLNEQLKADDETKASAIEVQDDKPLNVNEGATAPEEALMIEVQDDKPSNVNEGATAPEKIVVVDLTGRPGFVNQ